MIFVSASEEWEKPRFSRQTADEQQPSASDTQRIITARLKITHKDLNYGENGEIQVLKGHDISLTLFGFGLTEESKVKLTTVRSLYGTECKSDESHYVQTSTFLLEADPSGLKANLTIPGSKLPIVRDQRVFFFCLFDEARNEWVHQGDVDGASIEVYELLLPIWLMIVFIVILLCLSGLFSGLNLGLMALDQTELKIVQNTGTEAEKNYANKIAPIRAHGNFLLCSLLLGNVLVNNTLTILLDTLTSGLVAVIGATMGIVVFGEIIPQAICSRHGLAVGAYTIVLTKMFMLITFPLSYPISKLLDYLLGAEIGTVYDKKKLIELLRVTDDNNDLEKDEVNIVTGALVYKDKKVKDVMTKVEDVYMLPLGTVLDFETVAEIREQGYSRIPIFNEDRKNIVHILFAKDLMFIDPDDKMPIAMVCEFYQNEVNFVFSDTQLNVMFNDFKSGDKGHMAFVQEINSIGDGDPFYETVGLVTLEDIIEEIIQQEIVDETDVITDNRTKKRRKRDGWQGKEGTFPVLATEEKKRVMISPQLTMAVFQYLTTSIEPFKAPAINDSVLKRLLALDVFREVKLKKDKTKMSEEDLIIINKGKIIDFFILIIEGKVEVNIGREELVFESGPFTYFGIQVLNNIMLDGAPGSPMIGSPLAPMSAVRGAVTTPSSLVTSQSQDVNAAHGPKHNLRKASTQTAIELANSGGVNSKRHSLSQPDNSTHPLSKQHSAAFISPHSLPFVPEYTVKAVTDVLYLRIKKSTYIAAAKASMMNKKQEKTGVEVLNERELERYLEKVVEDDADPETLMMRTPSIRSPEKRLDSPTAVLAASVANAMVAVGGEQSTTGDSEQQAPKAEPEFWGDTADDKTTIVSDLAVNVANAGNGPASLPSGVPSTTPADKGQGAGGGGGDSDSDGSFNNAEERTSMLKKKRKDESVNVVGASEQKNNDVKIEMTALRKSGSEDEHA